MPPEENKAILSRAVEAWNVPEQRAQWFDIHDSSVVAYGLGPEPVGHQGVVEFYTGLWSAFRDAHVTVDELVAEGEAVVVRFTLTGTQEGDFLGVPASGSRVEITGHSTYHFRDGKVVERWTNADLLGILVQLGAVPAPG